MIGWRGCKRVGWGEVAVFVKRKNLVRRGYSNTHARTHARTHAHTHTHTHTHTYTYTHTHTRARARARASKAKFTYNLKRAANRDSRLMPTAARNGKHGRSIVLGNIRFEVTLE